MLYRVSSVYLTAPDSSNRLALALFPVLRMYLLSHDKALLRSYRFHSVYPCCFLALVILSHPSHCKEPCCFRFRQEFLQFLYCASIATLTGSVDALLDAVDMLLKLAPGQLVPSLTLRDKFLIVLGCFPLFHRTDFLPSLQQCLCQRILRSEEHTSELQS